MEKRVRDIRPGDVINGMTVLTRPVALVNTPKGKMEFVVQHPDGRLFTKVWGASTTIKTDVMSTEQTGPESGIIHFPHPEVVNQPVEAPKFSIESVNSVELAPVDKDRAYLVALAEKHKTLKVTAENLEEGKRARLELREARYAVQNWAKDKTAILNDLKRRLDDGADEYTNITRPEEERLDSEIKAIERAKAEAIAEKRRQEQEAIAAKIRAEEEERAEVERQRLAAIEEEQRLERERLEQIRLEQEARERELERLELERIAAAKVERDRIAAEEAERLEKIRQEDLARQKRIEDEDAERRRLQKLEDDRLQKIRDDIAAAAKAEQDKLAADRKKFDDEQAAIKAAQDAKESAEREAKELRERLARETEAARIKAENDEKERLAAIAREESLKPDREKILSWIRSFENPPSPELSTWDGQDMGANILESFAAFKSSWIAEAEALK